MADEYDVLGGYVPSFIQHLKDTSARLGLRIGSQADEDQDGVDGGAERCVEPQALSSWTPAEHDALFRAISVHSRWRLDLIAACVPTRSEWEVWMYLEALEQGAAALAMEDGDGDVDADMDVEEDRNVEMQVDSGSRSHSGSDKDEDVCEPALEVSQEWIDTEERMAAWIIDQEHRASLDDAAGEAEVDDKPPRTRRKRGRARGAGKRRAESSAQGETVSYKASPSPSPVRRSPSPKHVSPSAREASRDPSASSARKREALMARLEVPHLLVLDSLLREDEETMQAKSKSREGSIAAVTRTEHADDGAPRAYGMGVSGPSDWVTAPPVTSNDPGTSCVVIDPVLLALSGGADPGGSESALTSRRLPTQGSSSLSTASSQLSQPGPSNIFPQDSDIPPDPDVNAEGELSLPSPRSRRRIQKRLYMRRKRAQLRGDTVASEDTGIEKLKPGKKAKAKSERSETSVVSNSMPCSEAPSDAEAELPENVPKKNKPGLTLPYKLKAQFAELGIDATYLRDQGMDLLNLGALGRLMGLWSSLEQVEEESAIALSIDAQLIRHLQAAMVSYVTDMIHRAVVWREREIRLKQRSRVWRHSDLITVGAVEHAVDAFGARYHSHKAYFKALEAFHDGSAENAPPANATESVDPDVGAADLPVVLPGLSAHRDVFTPLIYPPWRTNPLACLTRTYEREATRTRRGTSAEIGEEELMSNETDSEALGAELEDEDKVDKLDMALAAKHELILRGRNK